MAFISMESRLFLKSRFNKILFNKVGRAEFHSSKSQPLSAEEIDHLLNVSYGGAGLVPLVSGSALRNEASQWIVGVDDEENYHWFIALKKTAFGSKFIYAGHDGEVESKAELKLSVRDMFHSMPNVYAEFSGAWLAFAKRWKLPMVPVQEAEEVLYPKEIDPVPGDCCAYYRKMSDGMHEKVMVGNPKLS